MICVNLYMDRGEKTMICIMGKSCSGKNTIVKELKKMGYKVVVTYTTRPPRAGEVDGEDYHFISNKEFKKMIKDDEFAEYKVYKGTWYYGSKIEDYINDKRVIILSPKGYKEIKDKYKISFAAIYLRVDDKTLRKRSLIRDGKTFERLRRYITDKFDFFNIENIADYVVDNNGDIKEAAMICNALNDIHINKIKRKKGLL